MDLLEPRLKVAPTAALVLSMARTLYTGGPAESFCERIDFSEAEPLVKQLTESIKELPELLLLRKQFIRYQLRRVLRPGRPVQICFLAAGLDPASLYLLEKYPDAISQIFEIDQGHMDVKRLLYPRDSRLHLILADVTDTLRLPGLLLDAGYLPSSPTVIIMEGLSPYITDTQFLNALQFFRTPNKTNMLVLDYMLPESAVPAASVPGFRLIRESVERLIEGSIQLYSRQDMLRLMAVLQGDVAGVDSMQDVEARLNGRNELFYAEGEGYIEMITCYI
ncbi:class I SAM-dependent methyltransferase [Chitinophaga lutea]